MDTAYVESRVHTVVWDQGRRTQVPPVLEFCVCHKGHTSEGTEGQKRGGHLEGNSHRERTWN